MLNSLTGQALTRSLGLLAPNGRFVEIGRQDVYADSHLGLGSLRHNRSFLAVDLERALAEQPDLIGELLDGVVRGFTVGEFTALPVTCFGYAEATEAFTLMARAGHTGKIVLRSEQTPTVAVRRTGRPVRPDATYLITGGLGALGLETARYLADQGARHLTLLGRGGASPAAERAIEELRTGRVEVLVRRADVASATDLAQVLAEIDDSLPPLAGVVHAAGILDDGLLAHLDRRRFHAVAAAKVTGAWRLHQATLDRPLDFFVLYSSAAPLLGSPGQGNYAAANAFLDALAHHRRALGLPALSINWGPWAQIGLAARAERGSALAVGGIRDLSLHDGVDALDRLLRSPVTQACVLPVDRRVPGAAAAAGLLPGLLADLVTTADQPAGGGPRGEVHDRLLAVEPGRRRVAILARHCAAEAARVLELDESRVDTTAPLASLGFDSLMSLELRRRLETSLGIELPATLAWRFPTIEALVPFLAERMGIALTTVPAGDPTGAAVSGASGVDPRSDDLEGLGASLDDLFASDVEALLLAKMTQIDGGLHA